MIALLNRSTRLSVFAAGVLLVSLSGCNKTKDMTANQPPVAIDTAADDSLITSKVKAALSVSDDLKSLDLQVQAQNHEVTLTGFANNRDQVDNSIAVTKSVDRVTNVVNHIIIRK